jgi:hypothetical protein
MALNEVYQYTRFKTRERPVPAGTVAGAPLLINTRPCVAITSRSDATKTFTLADGSSRTIPVGNPWQTAGSATVAFDGTFEFSGIAGLTYPLANDTAIYITAGNTLSTTAAGNTLFGYVDNPTSYTGVAGKAAVRIGV